MNISAKDKGTGKEQSIKIEASSGLSEEDIERMKAEAEANADSDAKLRAEVETVNKADSLIFQTERQLKEYGDKISAQKNNQLKMLLLN
jgi:molecular chaperone DnaK